MGEASRKGGNSGFDVRPLDSIMRQLGHQRVDLLKMDIEGAEWQWFDSHMLLISKLRPLQLTFELHTRFANPSFVLPALVSGRGRGEVHRLVRSLFKAGYHLLYKHLNSGDRAC